ncbi:ATP-binding protein [Streptococcus hyointestinalis]|uniref:ATP-binding protein n=1 Tax=Streptococcus hyointestinalis TaxID=1337 RepID=UPI0035162A9A
MAKDNFTLGFAPSAVQHLGVGLYKQLPQALMELITNSWDADASEVKIHIDYSRRSISVSDNGHGMTLEELNSNFLRVARNRRSNGIGLTPKGRKLTGKKGLGKLALFGVADRIQVISIKDNLKNGFEMNYRSIQATSEEEFYHPEALYVNESVNQKSGTEIRILDISLQNIAKMDSLALALSRRFNLFSRNNFLVILSDEKGKTIELDEKVFENSIKPSTKLDFTYRFPEDFQEELKTNNALIELVNKNVSGVVFTKETPLKATEQGFSVLSHGKLASEHTPHQFSERANDRFYDYATGYFDIDFIDDSPSKDFISTDRQAILWNADSDLQFLRENLNKLMGVIQKRWRQDWNQRKQTKAEKSQKDVPKIKKVLDSPDLLKKDKETIDTIALLLEDEKMTIPSELKRKILESVADATQTMGIEENVYKDLIPNNFVVPDELSNKIRMLRAETRLAATSADDPNRFILAQGLLLRGIIDTTITSLLVKYKDTLTKNKLWAGKAPHNDITYSKAVSVKNITLYNKYMSALNFFEFKGDCNKKNKDNLKSNFDDVKVIPQLDQLMHDEMNWPKFDKLKEMWDTVAPQLLLAFKYIKD